jgi:hypothetical protein
MTRIPYYAALLCALALGACNDQEQPTSTSPEFKITPPPDPLACSFDAIKSLVITYFAPPDQQTAQGFEAAMEPTPQSAAAVTNGFKLLDLMGKVSRSTVTTSSTTGGSLAKATIKCMFHADGQAYKDLAGGQGLDAVRFDLALSKADGGVFYAVGSGFPDAPTVLKGTVPGVGTLSKAAPGPATVTGTPPNQTVTLGNWSSVLSNGTALIYGYRVQDSPVIFEWATIDPGVTFTPYALVSICSGSTNDLMVLEGGVGVLSFDLANLCDLPGDATGRTVTGFKSPFKNNSVQNLTVRFDPTRSPPATWQPVTSSKPIAVFVSVPDPDVVNKTVGVLGVCVYITGSANNGTPTDITSSPLHQDSDCHDPPGGVGLSKYLSTKTTMTPGDPQSVADFGNVTITKTGGLAFTATADVIDRSGAGSVTKKINVKP